MVCIVCVVCVVCVGGRDGDFVGHEVDSDRGFGIFLGVGEGIPDAATIDQLDGGDGEGNVPAQFGAEAFECYTRQID